MKPSTRECEHCSGSGVVEFYTPATLRATRIEKGLSVRQMAKTLGYSASYISDIELGRRNPNQTIINFLKRV